jgi:hypothetical protein
LKKIWRHFSSLYYKKRKHSRKSLMYRKFKYYCIKLFHFKCLSRTFWFGIKWMKEKREWKYLPSFWNCTVAESELLWILIDFFCRSYSFLYYVLILNTILYFISYSIDWTYTNYRRVSIVVLNQILRPNKQKKLKWFDKVELWNHL